MKSWSHSCLAMSGWDNSRECLQHAAIGNTPVTHTVRTSVCSGEGARRSQCLPWALTVNLYLFRFLSSELFSPSCEHEAWLQPFHLWSCRSPGWDRLGVKGSQFSFLSKERGLEKEIETRQKRSRGPAGLNAENKLCESVLCVWKAFPHALLAQSSEELEDVSGDISDTGGLFQDPRGQ